MNQNLLSFVVPLCWIQMCKAAEEHQKEKNTTTITLNIIIVSISFVIIIAELIVFKKERYQQSLVPFAVYSEKIDQVTSSNDMPEKSSDMFEQPSSNNISPKDKSQEGGESSDRRKRKRKADKLSDRRSKEDMSFDGESK